MKKNIAIKIENLGKKYTLGEIGTGTLSHDLNRWWQRLRKKEDSYSKVFQMAEQERQAKKEIWPLRHINTEIEQGDIVGIIGKNGAGKSTLLKLISKITAPTEGRIKINGKVASLLEVGTGFYPEMTGRENVYLNGSILGMTKKEINQKFDEIVAFSGIEKFIDTPVKRYSSGMYVRLAFAVAAHLEPDILIVDEVLAVGDAEFQKKCLGKIKNVSQNQQRTVLFVSHNMGTIQKLCNKGILLENGHIKTEGDINKVIINYSDSLKNYVRQITDFTPFNTPHSPYFQPLLFSFANAQGEDIGNIFSRNDDIYIKIKFNVKESNHLLTFGIKIRNENGQEVLTSYHTDKRRAYWPKIIIGANTFLIKIPQQTLNLGHYFIELMAYAQGSSNLWGWNGKGPALHMIINGSVSNSPFWSKRREGDFSPILDFFSIDD